SQLKKPTTLHDLTAKDKQGRRRFHGAFTGGFSAGYFNTVGTKEGFTPSTFVSSKSRKSAKDGLEQTRYTSQPEDFMDDEDLEEHGIAPRKFATAGIFTSEERSRKRVRDANQIASSSQLDLGAALNEIVAPGNLTIGIKLLRKMGWKEGQGLGPRMKQKKKAKKKISQPVHGLKIYGCAPPPSDDSDSTEEFVPEDMSSVTFAPKDITPISVLPKENVHGLGYRGLDPTLALPSSHINLFSAPPVRSKSGRKGISGQAFGVGAFEDEDEDIYAVDSISNYDITMQAEEEGDNKFGWTAPREHGKQSVPVTYVGKLLEGFCLSNVQLKPKKKFPAPALPRGFKSRHWFRKQREASHIPEHLKQSEDNSTGNLKLNATDRGILLGETPIMSSVFDLIPTADRERINATKEAINMTSSLASSQHQPAITSVNASSSSSKEPITTDEQAKQNLPSNAWASKNFLSRFQPAVQTSIEVSQQADDRQKAPLFQNGLTFQPFRKDQAKQKRYDQYLTLLKQNASDPYNAVASPSMTEWERARERDEFSKAAKMFRPLSAMMSSRFVSGAMIDDDIVEASGDSEMTKTDEVKAAEMKMFGKLTREEHEWHPHQLLCKRFNVPNPYPGSDTLGIPGVKRDKYSVFNFLSMGDFQSGETQEPSLSRQPQEEKAANSKQTVSAARPKTATMASVFKVLDDPNFHKPARASEKPTPTASLADTTASTEKSPAAEENFAAREADIGTEEPAADMDLFRAIFKNSDSEDSEEDDKEDKEELPSEDEDKDELNSPESGYEEAEMVEQHPEEQVTVKSEMPESDEANQGTFRPLFTPRRKTDSAISREIDAQPSHTLQDALPENLTDSPDTQVAIKKTWGSRLGGKSVFSVLENMEKTESSKEISSELNKNWQVTNYTGSDESDDAEAYGPRLPSASLHTQSTTPKPMAKDKDGDSDVAAYGPTLPPSSLPTHAQEIRERGRASEKHSGSRGRESKSAHRKEKKKKSKHRKQKKHKKHKKSSRSRKGQSSSGSEADTESDSADSVSDSELLERLRDISKSSKSLQQVKHL
ncbi:G patch domain-containing protein 1, partial [Plakobranchus ocellatus]